MPRTRSLHWIELKTGILAVVTLAIAASVIFMLSGEGGFFWQRYTLRTRFDNVAGLKPGAPVRVAGVEVGSVEAVDFEGSQVEVTFDISRELQPRITTESRAMIGSVSLLGESALDLTASAEGTPLPEYGFVPSRRTPGQLSDVAEGATRALEQAGSLIGDIRAGKGTVGRLFTDEQLYREIEGVAAAAEEVATNLRRGRGTLGRLATDETVYNELSASLENLRQITARISQGEGSLGRLLNNPAFAESLTATTQNLQQITQQVSKGQGTLGQLVNDPALYNRLDTVVQRLDTLTEQLAKGQGTAGALLQDRQLYENLNTAASELRNLIADIRKDPQKYLRVNVSIF